MHLVHVIRGLIPAHAGKTRPPWPGGHGSPAHPRSRGENASSSMPIKSAYGSSPLTRGKHVATPSWAARPRLIPAHAGKTNTLITTMFYNKAHPRSRGENTALVSQRFQFGNSSPLTRGKLSNGLRSPSRPRLIPAHAGKTRSLVWPLGCFPAHPRSRGENPLISSKKHPFGGSSPLTRGKRNHYRPTLRDRRLIPAHAGKTAPPSGARVSEPAHPRSRGENFSFVSHDGTP